MGKDMLDAALDIREFLVSTYHEFHQYPELSHQEAQTSRCVADRLAEADIEVQEGIGGYGVVGVLYGQDRSRTVALRADMDALPVQEQTGSPFASRNLGCMHACGHDAHMTMVLGAARLLRAREQSLKHNVKFIFQPAEEYTPPGPGAKGMIEDGVLTNPPVDAIFALHVWPDVPTGRIGVKTGATMAAIDVFEFEFSGTGGHGALPHETSDVVVAVAEAVMACQTIVSRRLSPVLPAVLTVGSIQSGTRPNVIPTRAVCRGSSRYVHADQGKAIREGMAAILRGLSEAYAVQHKMDYANVLPPTTNDDIMVQRVVAAGKQVLGPANVMMLEQPAMVSEDFSLYLQEVPGCMFFLGTGTEQGASAGLHSAYFQIDERILPLGSAVLAQIAFDFSTDGEEN